MKKLLPLLLCFTFWYSAKATHIVGGELFYNSVGNNVYQITLKLYRDCGCLNCAQYANPEYVTIFNSAGSVYTQLALPLPPVTQLPSTYSNACILPPAVCTQEADFTANITLPPSPGGYTIVYQRCCRNAGVVNLLANQGATYTAQIPDTSLAPHNSSARFSNLPPLFVCLNQPLSLSYAAIDPDGDSLAYSLADPFLGADGNCPDPSPNGAVGSCPTYASAPPYTPITYATPYSSGNFTNNPSSTSNLVIDPHTGILTGTPNAEGLYDVTVCVNEYRHGHLLNVLRRDFQFTVAQCGIGSAAISTTGVNGNGQAVYGVACKSLVVNFVNASYNHNPSSPLSYHWDFGVNGSATDTSDSAVPLFAYPDTGIYNITLIASLNNQNGTICSDTSNALIYVYPILQPNFSAPVACQNLPVTFTNQTISTSGSISYTFWNFGDGTSSTQTSPTHTYNTQGEALVSLVEENTAGCKDSFLYVETILNEQCISGISTMDSDSYNITLYPNPAKNYFTLAYHAGAWQSGNIQIYNALGQLVLQKPLPLNTNQTNIETNLLAEGIYTYAVWFAGQRVKHDKFIVLRN